MKNINKFCKETGFKYIVGEIGFGRPCVGIYDAGKDSFVAYSIRDEECDLVAKHTIAREKAPGDSYHKGDYLAVLMHPKGENVEPKDIEKANNELDGWLKSIMESGFKIQTYLQKDGVNQLLGIPASNHKAIVDK